MSTLRILSATGVGLLAPQAPDWQAPDWLLVAPAHRVADGRVLVLCVILDALARAARRIVVVSLSSRSPSPAPRIGSYSSAIVAPFGRAGNTRGTVRLCLCGHV